MHKYINTYKYVPLYTHKCVHIFVYIYIHIYNIYIYIYIYGIRGQTSDGVPVVVSIVFTSLCSRANANPETTCRVQSNEGIVSENRIMPVFCRLVFCRPHQNGQHASPAVGVHQCLVCCQQKTQSS